MMITGVGGKEDEIGSSISHNNVDSFATFPLFLQNLYNVDYVKLGEPVTFWFIRPGRIYLPES